MHLSVVQFLYRVRARQATHDRTMMVTTLTFVTCADDVDAVGPDDRGGSLGGESHKEPGGQSRVPELCESRGGRPRLPVPNKPHRFCGRKATLN